MNISSLYTDKTASFYIESAPNLITVQRQYNTVNFLINPQNGSPINEKYGMIFLS